jgi:hypothetical protein
LERWERRVASKRIKIRKSGPNRRRNWIAVGTLAAYSATGAGKLALAQQPLKA